MTLADSFLFDAGWLFFAAWTVIVAAVSIVAFGRDVVPRNARINPARKSQPAGQVHPTQSSTL